MDPTSLLETTRTWPTEDRLEFAVRLWDELLDSGWQPEPDDNLATELDQRLDAHEANPGAVRTSEEVWGRIRGQK